MSANNHFDSTFGNDSDSSSRDTESVSDETRQDSYEVGKDWLNLVRASQRAMNVSDDFTDEQYQLQRRFGNLLKQALYGHTFGDEHGLGSNLPFKTTSYVNEHGFEVPSGLAHERFGPGEVAGLDEVEDPDKGIPVLDFPNKRNGTSETAPFYRLPVIDESVVPIIVNNEEELERAKDVIKAFFGPVTDLSHVEWNGNARRSKDESQKQSSNSNSETDELPETLRALEPLLEVSGIGPSILREIREWALERDESFEINPDDLMDDRTIDEVSDEEMDRMSEAELRALVKRSR